MKLSFYLTVFAVAALVELSRVQALPVESNAEPYSDSLKPLIRVARQDFPPPPPGMSEDEMKKQMPPPPPGMMKFEGMNRRKREAKGGGSMPTRKG